MTTVSDTFALGKKTMVPGTEFAVAGERGGRFRFLNHVVADGVEWINCLGGKKGHEMWRSFRPERVTRITRLIPLPPNVR